jgi:molybdate transport system substrate-binding protein
MKYFSRTNFSPVRRRCFATCLLLASAWAGTAQASELSVAAASDLNFAFKEIVVHFERQTGTHVKLSLGSSGNLFSQIQNGAPFDLYFSADIRYPQKLEESGHAVPGSLYRYATGRIVVWVPARSPLDIAQRGIDALRDPSVHKIAIANPKHAPYGRAAVAAMEHFNIYEHVKDRLVLGENVSQAAQFVESGAAEIGVIALSLALAPPMEREGRYWEVPLDAYPSLDQGAVIVRRGANEADARAFLTFMQGEEGQVIMRRHGFTITVGASGSRSTKELPRR